MNLFIARRAFTRFHPSIGQHQARAFKPFVIQILCFRAAYGKNLTLLQVWSYGIVALNEHNRVVLSRPNGRGFFKNKPVLKGTERAKLCKISR